MHRSIINYLSCRWIFSNLVSS